MTREPPQRPGERAPQAVWNMYLATLIEEIYGQRQCAEHNRRLSRLEGGLIVVGVCVAAILGVLVGGEPVAALVRKLIGG